MKQKPCRTCDLRADELALALAHIDVLERHIDRLMAEREENRWAAPQLTALRAAFAELELENACLRESTTPIQPRRTE